MLEKPLATSVTIELAPEAYGAMTVSMKFSSSGVSLHIAVTSQNALSLIRDLQQRLRDALEFGWRRRAFPDHAGQPGASRVE